MNPPQDSATLFFLHCSSYEALKLPQLAIDSVPAVTSCVGKVEHKEYCVARKDENRYKVPKGTNFYRVKVRPRSPGRETKSKGELKEFSQGRFMGGNGKSCSTTRVRIHI